MISFENTEIAFRYKTTNELKKAYILFKTIAKPWLVKIGSTLLHVSLKTKIPLNWILKPTIYSHFVGGENTNDCKKTVVKLNKYKVKSILDYSVEGKENDEDINLALNETLKSIKNASNDPNIPFAVFKPTAFAKSYILEKFSANSKLKAR